MGNVLSLGNSSVGITDDGALPNPGNQSLTLWDMMIHLFKRYVVSKVENDEFLCAYLLNNDHKLTFLRMGQRAITYESANLPSRVVYDEKYERRARELDKRAKMRSNSRSEIRPHPRIQEAYYEEASEEDYSTSTSEDESSEEIVLNPTSNSNDNNLKMYALYSKLDNLPTLQ